jgi:hypothetical protein
MPASSELLKYHDAGKPLVCELDANPYCCEFWLLEDLDIFNREFQVPDYAPGFFGFATSGGGEMFAISPTGTIVCLPFIGMAPDAAMQIAATWSSFERMLRGAV